MVLRRRVVIYPIGTGEAKTVPTGNVLVTNARWLARRQSLHGHRHRTVPRRARLRRGRRRSRAPRAITPERVTFSAEQIALSHDRRIVAFRSPDGVMTLYHTDGSAATKANGFAADEMPIGWTGDDRSLLLLTDDSPRQLVAVDPAERPAHGAQDDRTVESGVHRTDVGVPDTRRAIVCGELPAAGDDVVSRRRAEVGRRITRGQAVPGAFSDRRRERCPGAARSGSPAWCQRSACATSSTRTAAPAVPACAPAEVCRRGSSHSLHCSM